MQAVAPAAAHVLSGQVAQPVLVRYRPAAQGAAQAAEEALPGRLVRPAAQALHESAAAALYLPAAQVWHVPPAVRYCPLAQGGLQKPAPEAACRGLGQGEQAVAEPPGEMALGGQGMQELPWGE